MEKLQTLVRQYRDIVAVGGPQAPEALKMRETHAGDTEFLAYADLVDDFKRDVGGLGIETQKGELTAAAARAPALAEA